jgi:hypothetical protein
MGELSIYLVDQPSGRYVRPLIVGMDILRTWTHQYGIVGRFLDMEFEHTIEFGLSRGEKLIDDIHREIYSSKIDLRLGYHQTTFGCHYGHYEVLQLGVLGVEDAV